MGQDQSVQVGIGVLIIRDAKVLLGHRIGAHGANTWGLPGGHLDFGETFEECAAREVKEETNLDISGLKCVAVTNDLFIEEGKHYVTLFIQAEHFEGELKLNEPNKCLAWQWFDWHALPTPLFTSLANLKKQGFELNS
jgi:8-oxo-dGTP diphosphatase